MRNIERLHERADNMRHKPTFHEKKFKERLEMAELNYISQKVIGNYIVDFVVGKKIIEIDGASHFEAHQAVYDKERTDYLEKCGYEVIRVRNEHIVSFDMNRLKIKTKRIVAKPILPAGPVKIWRNGKEIEIINRKRKITQEIKKDIKIEYIEKPPCQVIKDNKVYRKPISKDPNDIKSLFHKKKPWECQ